MAVVRRLVPALIQAWRDLRFEQGMYLDPSGVRRERLRLEKGSHPLPGAQYRLLAAGEGQSSTTEPASHTIHIALVADDADHVQIRARSRGAGEWDVEAELLRTAWADRLHVEVSGSTGGGWITGGKVSAFATVDLDRIPSDRRDDPQIEVRGSHRVIAGTGQVAIRELHDGHWEVTVGLATRGRGCLWPVAALAGSGLRRTIRRGVEDALQELAAAVAELNQSMAEELGAVNGHVDMLATTLLHEALADITEG
jgi:hypothetical protein